MSLLQCTPYINGNCSKQEKTLNNVLGQYNGSCDKVKQICVADIDIIGSVIGYYMLVVVLINDIFALSHVQ